MCTRWRHRLEERPEHLAALVADVAHHLELLVDDHEELVDLLLVAQEVQQPGLDVGLRVARQPEGAADRVHPHVARRRIGRRALRAGADQVPVAGEEHVGPVGAALALEQPAEDGQRLVDAPVGDLRAVVPPDDEVGALALPDLVGDDRLDELAVRRVVGLEAAAVGELDAGVVDRVDRPRRPRTPARSRCRPRPAGCRRRAPRSRARPPAGTGSRPAGRRCAPRPGRRPRAGRRGSTRPRCVGRPTRPTVSRSPSRVERRMIAHASCPWSASIAVRASVVGVMAAA